METTKKSNTGIIVIGAIVVLGLIGGAIYLFTKGSAPEKTTSTTTTGNTTTNTGLSGLLAGLNLSGLHIGL